MPYTTYNCDALTGGATRALDAIPIAGLSTGFRAFTTVVVGSVATLHDHIFDAVGTDAENAPFIIRPDDYTVSGVWRLAGMSVQFLDVGGDLNVAGNLDVGSGTTKRVAPTATFGGYSDGSPYVINTELLISNFLGPQITENAWKSIGPTGGLKDYTWTALNSVPVDADWIDIILDVDIDATGMIAGNPYTYYVNVRNIGGTGTQKAQRMSANGAEICMSSVKNQKVNVTDRAFELYWSWAGTGDPMARVKLAGYGFNT